MLCRSSIGKGSGCNVGIVHIQLVVDGQTKTGTVQFDRQVVVQDVGVICVTVVKDGDTDRSVSHFTGFCQEVEAVSSGNRGLVFNGLIIYCCPGIIVASRITGSGANLQAVKRGCADFITLCTYACLEHSKNFSFCNAAGNGAVFFQNDLVVAAGKLTQGIEVVACKAVLLFLNPVVCDTVELFGGRVLVVCSAGGVNSIVEVGVINPFLFGDGVLEAVDQDSLAYTNAVSQCLLQHVLCQTALCNVLLDGTIRIVDSQQQIVDRSGILICAIGVEVQRFRSNGYANVVIQEFQILQQSFAVVGQLEAVVDRLLGIHIAIVANFHAILITGLLGQHGGVNDLDVGLDTEVGSGTVTLHVVEVKVVGLTVAQTTQRGNVVQIDGNLTDGVRTTQVQNAGAVDVQIHVIVTGEGEVEVLIIVVDKLCMTFQRQVVVGGAVVFSFVILSLGKTKVRIVIGVKTAGHTVTQFLTCAAETHGVKTVFSLNVAAGICRATICVIATVSHLSGLRVDDVAILVIILGVVVSRVEGVVDAAVCFGLLNQTDFLVFRSSHAVAFHIVEGGMQQEVGSIVVAVNILNGCQRAAFKICLCFGIAARIAVDLAAQNGCQVTGGGAALANIVVIVVKQLVAHDIPQIVGTVSVPPDLG